MLPVFIYLLSSETQNYKNQTFPPYLLTNRSIDLQFSFYRAENNQKISNHAIFPQITVSITFFFPVLEGKKMGIYMEILISMSFFSGS